MKVENRKIKIFFVLMLLSVISVSFCQQKTGDIKTEEDFTRYVNPFIGTSGPGHTYVGATSPMGLVQLGPNTGNFTWDYHSGYQYADSTVRGFAHTHTSGGANPLLGDLLILPFKNQETITNENVSFSKQSEKASPGYYAIILDEEDIQVELSTTPRTGFHKYTFLEGGRLSCVNQHR